MNKEQIKSASEDVIFQAFIDHRRAVQKRLEQAKSREIKAIFDSCSHPPSSKLADENVQKVAPEEYGECAPSSETPQHYGSGLGVPWDAQKKMESSGNAFVDARRCDGMKYAFRVKSDLEGDLRKGAHCLLAAADELRRLNNSVVEDELQRLNNSEAENDVAKFDFSSFEEEELEYLRAGCPPPRNFMSAYVRARNEELPKSENVMRDNSSKTES